VIAGGLRGVPLASGRAATAPGEIVADQTLHVGVGGTVVIQGATLHVVGVTHGETIDAGFPIVVLTIDDARTLFLGNQPIQNAVVITGTPASLPPDLRAMSNAAVLTDALRPLKTPLQTLRASRSAMWVIAALIVAALLYVSVLERVRDFAVLKSLGASSASLFSGIAIQAVIVTILAAVVSVPTANGLKPLIFPEQFAIPRSAYLVLPLIAVGVGLLSSLVGLRRATGADPSLAFG
jgi:putative ABC transport system permease protein